VNKIKQTALILAIIASTQITNAMNYAATNSDLLLLIRGTSGSICVEVDLGSVSNLLGLAPNVVTNIAPPNFSYLTNQVKTNYNNSYSNAIFTIIGTTGQKVVPHGLWSTDSDSGVPGVLTPSQFSGVQSALGGNGTGIGGIASVQTGNVTGSNFVSTSTTPINETYVSIFSQQSQPVSDFGGNLPFTVEGQPTNSMAFYQFIQTNGLASTYVPTLAGSFYMNPTNGAITFTRASAVVVRTLVPSQIVGVLRAGDNTQVSFTTTNGNNYQLLYKTDVTQAGWITNSAAGVVAGNNATNTLEDTTTDEQRFYRIQSF
jgi:hypothetical protein